MDSLGLQNWKPGAVSAGSGCSPRDGEAEGSRGSGKGPAAASDRIREGGGGGEGGRKEQPEAAGSPGGCPPPLQGGASGQFSGPQQVGSALYLPGGDGPVAAEKRQARDLVKAGSPGGCPPPLRGGASGQLSGSWRAGSALCPLEVEEPRAGDPENEVHREVADKAAADGCARAHPA